MPYPFKQIFAADPSTPDVVAGNSEVTIFTPGDESRTPLEITDPTGVPLPNPIHTDEKGFASAFIADIPQVAWEGAGLTGFLESFEGMRVEAASAAVSAMSAQASADASAESAAAAAATAATQVTVELSDALAAVQQAASDAAAAANLVEAPADTAIAAAIQGEDTETAAALDNTAANLVGKAESLTAQAISDSIAAKVKGELVVSVKDKAFGAKGDGVTDDTAAIQSAIDYVQSVGGGTVYIPDGRYKVSASTLPDVFDNAGAPVLASTGCLILRKNVSLSGVDRARCRIFAEDAAKTVIYHVAPENTTISDLEVSNVWSVGVSGAGHGIFTLSQDGNNALRNVTWRNLYVHNVASYGIGLQSGVPTGCVIDNVKVAHNGADGLDLKSRTDPNTRPNGNSCSNVHVINHGQRVTGSSGVDVRGVWQLANIVVTDFGATNPSLSYVGIRFRTKPDPINTTEVAGDKSSLNGFLVRAAKNTVASIDGVYSGSDDVHISNGVIEDCTKNGVSLNGNSNGSAMRNTVTSVTVSRSEYGFITSSGSDGSVFIGCTSRNSTIAGFRNTGKNTSFTTCNSVDDVAALSTSVGAAPTEIVNGCRFSADSAGVSTTSPGVGRLRMLAKGDATDIDLEFTAKGAGKVRFGAHTSNADSPITGYIEIKDAAGVIRKLAVIA